MGRILGSSKGKRLGPFVWRAGRVWKRREEKRRRERKEIVLWQNSYSGWSHEDLKGWLVRASLNQDWPRELCTVVASPPF